MTMFRWMRRTRKGLKDRNSLLGDGKEHVEVVVVDQKGPTDVEETAGQRLEIGSVGNHAEDEVGGLKGPRGVEEWMRGPI